jgi:ATP-binding cassette, subfamily F, member 3
VSLLVLEDVTLHFGARTIFDGVGLRVADGDRIGLIGPNGSGKTTLLKVIAGQQEIDKGGVKKARGTRIGYLPQDLAVAGGKTLIDFVLSSVPGRQALEAERAEAEAELEQVKGSADDDTLMALAEQIAHVHERIDHFERFFSEHQAHRILAGLGFEERDRDRDLGEFSGGWKMRAVLAGLLYQQPDLLLLDEPTNHLDMPSVGWFSDFLQTYKRAFILISHDREFLDEQIRQVVSFEPEGLRSYEGNYESYVKQRAEEAEILENKAKNLAREREHMEKFVTRFRAQANKAKAVQSRVKALAKLEDVELYQRRKVMRFHFAPTKRPVGEVMKLEQVRKAYGSHIVFPELSITVRRGEKIGIIGVNGAGKTTLLRMMAGELPHDGGTIKTGSGVDVGYYAQHHADTLDAEATVYEEVQRSVPDESPGRVRNVLGAFLFGGDDVDKPIRVLSGGERARVALAKLMLKPGNVLLMDEPTNHLDLSSSESLTQSLTEYDGTLIFVSHNRSLIRNVATKIWNVEGGGVETYPGTLDEYLYSMRLRREASGTEPGAAAAPTAPAAAPDPGAKPTKGNREEERLRKQREAELRNKRHKLIGPIEKRIADLEARIATLETEQTQRSADLSDPAVYADDNRRNQLLNAFQDAQTKLDELTGRWEASVEELEKAEAELGDGLD